MKQLSRWLDGDLFYRQFEVPFPDCDKDKNQYISSLLKELINTSAYHYDDRGMTYAFLCEKGQAFLMARMDMVITTYPKVSQLCTIITKEQGAKGVTMYRDYCVMDEDENVMVTGKSAWVLVDIVSHKMLRPNQFAGEPLPKMGESIWDCPPCDRITTPKEGWDYLEDRTVRYTELDANGHLYSGRYGDYVVSALPTDLREKCRITGFRIQYHKEAKLGETIRLEGQLVEDTYFVHGTKGNDSCFTAAVTVSL